ncbi:MAG: hypothetical protein JW829_11455 [Pirellulales bacterium]|nr:hypothetical protein [Pirellulales bacterium]
MNTKQKDAIRCIAMAAIMMMAGCQSGLAPNGHLIGFGKTAKERKIERLAKTDPFPSPSDVGLKE